MAQEVLRQVTIAGGNATIFLEDDELNEIVLKDGSAEQIETVRARLERRAPNYRLG